MELALDIIGERFTTLYQMSKPTYLSRDVFAPLEIGILTYINHGGHLARLPVSYTSSLSFCHSSHVVVYFILLSVVSQFCSGLRRVFSSHTGQHEKLVPVSPVLSILCTYSGTSLLRSPTGLGKSDFNGEVTILQGVICTVEYNLGLNQGDCNGEVFLLVR